MSWSKTWGQVEPTFSPGTIIGCNMGKDNECVFVAVQSSQLGQTVAIQVKGPGIINGEGFGRSGPNMKSVFGGTFEVLIGYEVRMVAADNKIRFKLFRKGEAPK